MQTRIMIRLVVALGVAACASAAFAASADEFKAAFAKAEAAEQQAVTMKASWTTTTNALKAAKKAADSGNYDEAVKLAEHATVLANASIAQAKEQETLWRDAVVR